MLVEHAWLSLYFVNDLAGCKQLTYNTLLVGWVGYVKDEFFNMRLVRQSADFVILFHYM